MVPPFRHTADTRHEIVIIPPDSPVIARNATGQGMLRAGRSGPERTIHDMAEPHQHAVDRAPGPVVGVVVGLSYLALAQYIIWLNDPVNAGAGYWPAAGITLAALLLVPARRWPWVLGAVVVAEIGGSALHGYPVAASAWWAAGNAAEPLVAAVVLRRLGRGSGRLSPLHDLLAFLACGVVLGPLVGAVIGSVGTHLEFGRPWPEVAVKWAIGDGLGVLVVAPLLLCWREEAGPRRSRLEGVALAVLVVAAPFVAFRSWSSEWDVVLPYVVFPMLMWASVRFGVRGAAVTGFALAEVASIGTALGYGPFHDAATADDRRVAVLQVFLGTALTAGLVIATFVADSLRRARAYEHQRSAASALQAAVLPEQLPEVPGVELAARYAPAFVDASLHVGGDWYDVFALPSGATALAIGDVAGHDLPAAVVMAQLRNGMRSLFMETEDAAHVLAALDRQLALGGDGVIATAICASYRDGVVTWANAGHPPLLLAAADGSVRLLEDDPCPVLGIGDGEHRTHTVALAPGDVLVGFTDGLVEHRSWPLGEALDSLVSLVERTPTREPDALCSVLLEQGLGGRRREDDVCVLVARRT